MMSAECLFLLWAARKTPHKGVGNSKELCVCVCVFIHFILNDLRGVERKAGCLDKRLRGQIIARLFSSFWLRGAAERNEKGQSVEIK